MTKAPSFAGGRHRRAVEKYSFEEAHVRLRDYLRNHDFGNLTDYQKITLTRFYGLLMAEQEFNNFTRLLKLKDVVIKHFIDCLIVPKLVSLKFPLLDLGTGPGFPGIPLKILFPDQKIILAEGVQKRVDFLKKVRDELELQNLDILGRNINDQFMYPVEGVITRAVEDVSNTLGNVSSCLKSGGQVFLMKGPNVDPEISMAQKKWESQYFLVKDQSYNLPKTPHLRRLLVYQKS